MIEAATHALWQFEKDECGFAFNAARKDGITYAEAVGFDPMPSETMTCRSSGWVIQMGQHPPQAPTPSIVLIGFGPERRGSRKFDVRDESSNWRETKLVTVHNGCGGIEGIVTPWQQVVGQDDPKERVADRLTSAATEATVPVALSERCE